MTEAWIRLPLPLRKLAPGTALKAILLHRVGGMSAHETRQHPVGRAVVSHHGMARVTFHDTEAGRTARALVADDLLDVAAGAGGRLLLGNFRDAIDADVEKRRTLAPGSP